MRDTVRRVVTAALLVLPVMASAGGTYTTCTTSSSSSVSTTMPSSSSSSSVSSTSTSSTTSTLPGSPVCIESFNPAGKNIPPAGLTLPGTKGGQNPDGFYLIGSTDGTSVCVINDDGSAQFGPFISGSTVKITEAPGATPGDKPIGGPKSAVIDHITLDTDPLVCLIVGDVCSARCVSCLVPPPPK
jgi:hypothetical protein